MKSVARYANYTWPSRVSVYSPMTRAKNPTGPSLKILTLRKELDVYALELPREEEKPEYRAKPRSRNALPLRGLLLPGSGQERSRSSGRAHVCSSEKRGSTRRNRFCIIFSTPLKKKARDSLERFGCPLGRLREEGFDLSCLIINFNRRSTTPRPVASFVSLPTSPTSKTVKKDCDFSVIVEIPARASRPKLVDFTPVYICLSI